jgi:hypothetical protein
MKSRLSILVMWSLFAINDSVTAQATAVSEKALSVSPAKVPVPALKYELLPEAKDISSGNAVQLYYRAFAPEWYAWFTQHRWQDRIDRWLKLPYAEAVQDHPTAANDEAENEEEKPITATKKSDLAFLKTLKQLDELDRAARRSHAEWELWERARQEGASLILPDLYVFPNFAALLRVRIRLYSMDGDFSKSVYTLQTGFAMARHLNECGIVINSLVSLNVADQMCNALEEIIQLPGCPNCYWALTQLPKPLVDLRRALQTDRFLYLSMFPDLDDLEKRIYSKEEIAVVFDRALKNLERFGGGQLRSNVETIGIGMMVAREYPAAKAWLATQGRSADQIAAMPATQAFLLYANYRYLVFFDEFMKWYGLPPMIVRPHLYEATESLKREVAKMQISFVFAKLLIPSFQRLYETQLGLERRLAALSCIEAIRNYAALHQGKLPEQLDQIKELPVPPDPATGQPFLYQKEDNNFTLRAADLQPPTPGKLEYKVTVKP